MTTDLRRWLAFGTGVAIEIRNDELQTTIARVRPNRTAVLGSATVTEYKTRPAGEWGTELTRFLRKLGYGHVAATVLLPRRDVIIRQLSLPGVSDSDLEGAIQLQIDGLHPFGEEEVYYSWGRLGKTDSVLIGITRRQILDGYVTMFAEAGIKVASFTYGAAVLYSALRITGVPPQSGFLTVLPASGADEAEFYGESEARPVFSALLAADADRSLDFARSELRLDPSTELTSVVELLVKPDVFPESYDPAGADYPRNLLAYAAALVSACRWLAIEANLLPASQRRGSSRVRLIPTFALGTVLLLLLGALGAQSKYEDSRYLHLLQGEIRKLDPQARKVDSLDKQIASTRSRAQLLDDFRRRTKLDIDSLQDVTRIIAPPGWVSSLELDRNTIQFGGELEQAATLLRLLDNSPYFAQSQFTTPITRQGVGEAFRVRASRESPSAPAAIQQAPAQLGAAAPPQAQPTPAPSAPNPFSAGAAK